MKSIQLQLSQRVGEAIAALGAEGDPLVRASQDPKFGDYQSNCAMGLAKKLGRKPRDVAEELVDRLRVSDCCEPPEIAGPGFINFRVKPAFLAHCLNEIPPAGEGDRLGIAPVAEPKTIAVDLSSPNLAKEMHVGHLRSTVIGDCICRMLEFAGHTVFRENHVGDWGTQFGMLLAHLRRERPEVLEEPDSLVISDLEDFYVAAKSRFDADEAFREESRQTVVDLQSGDEVTRKLWKAFCDESLRHCHAIYDRLGVRLIDRGESFYAEGMEEVAKLLEERKADGGLVRESDGALCVFMDGFTARDGDPLPMIVRKSDGGFNYSASDLATILHRVNELSVDRIIYVVGIPQKLHFQMVFAAVRALGWVDERLALEHYGFGSMLSSTGKPFKTREGGTVKLRDLLDEAVARARQVVEDQSDGSLSESQIAEISEKVGLGAVKYYDLSHALQSDYRFDLDSMLSLDGNTAPYMMYAYARIRSIGRKAGVDFSALPEGAEVVLDHPAELALAKKILQFAEALELATRDGKPIVLTEYLFELSKEFSRFYDRKIGVRVIDASPEAVRWSRLRLCDLAARTLKLGLSLLGIETVEQM